MRFTLEIESDGAALSEEGRGHELARILHAVADRVAESAEAGEADSGILRDVNGNRVGWWELEEPEEEEQRP